MKSKTVQKKLLLESLSIVVGLSLLGGLLYLLTSWHDEKERENRRIKTQVTSLRNEAMSLDSKYTTWRQNNLLYEEALKKRVNNQLTVSRMAIRKLFSRYNKEFTLKKVNLQIQPVKKIASAPYNKKTVRMVYSEVTIDFQALTDADVFLLLAAMHKDFPGKIKILSVDVEKEKRVSTETVKQIASKGAVEMVSATVRFLWIGIEPIEIGANGTP